jgi:hypothetical protein
MAYSSTKKLILRTKHATETTNLKIPFSMTTVVAVKEVMPHPKILMKPKNSKLILRWKTTNSHAHSSPLTAARLLVSIKTLGIFVLQWSSLTFRQRNRRSSNPTKLKLFHPI